MRLLSTFSVLALAASLLLGTTALRAADAPAKDAGTITGKVVDKDGNAVKDATVNVVVPPAAGAPAPTTRPTPVATGKSGEDGSFKIEGVAAGKYTVMAMMRDKGMGRTKDPVTVEAGKTVDAGTLKLEARQGGGRRGGGAGGAAGGAAPGANAK